MAAEDKLVLLELEMKMQILELRLQRWKCPYTNPQPPTRHPPTPPYPTRPPTSPHTQPSHHAPRIARVNYFSIV